jgi:hypothetical protein
MSHHSTLRCVLQHISIRVLEYTCPLLLMEVLFLTATALGPARATDLPSLCTDPARCSGYIAAVTDMLEASCGGTSATDLKAIASLRYFANHPTELGADGASLVRLAMQRALDCPDPRMRERWRDVFGH